MFDPNKSLLIRLHKWRVGGGFTIPVRKLGKTELPRDFRHSTKPHLKFKSKSKRSNKIEPRLLLYTIR